jgi:hypothetical protein
VQFTQGLSKTVLAPVALAPLLLIYILCLDLGLNLEP